MTIVIEITASMLRRMLNGETFAIATDFLRNLADAGRTLEITIDPNADLSILRHYIDEAEARRKEKGLMNGE